LRILEKNTKHSYRRRLAQESCGFCVRTAQIPYVIGSGKGAPAYQIKHEYFLSDQKLHVGEKALRPRDVKRPCFVFYTTVDVRAMYCIIYSDRRYAIKLYYAITKNTFCGTRYLSHCCALFCN